MPTPLIDHTPIDDLSSTCDSATLPHTHGQTVYDHDMYMCRNAFGMSEVRTQVHMQVKQGLLQQGQHECTWHQVKNTQTIAAMNWRTQHSPATTSS